MERWLAYKRLAWLWLLLGMCALGIFAMANYTQVDLMLADRMFDFNSGQFTYQHAFFFDTVMHRYARDLLLGVWLVLLVFALLPGGLRPSGFSSSQQYRLRWVAALAVMHSGLVSWLKHRMPHACPWDITRYGGTSDWFPAFAAHGPQMAGHCFPAGHASSGLWLSALCLCWLPQHPRKALVIALAGLAVGFVLGWCQQIRGAHFLSHTLTSVWLMCALLLCVLSFFNSGYASDLYSKSRYA
ncbi:MAG TPA: phosphatase PAP2 family protein [Methylophilus sp.]|uniref:phosphatase PAP2 family protein n=1 Tax=Methylophilus sp. TaxID=29541 RepID=UPI002B591C92|nr:phosphatase PAP2 family protein [Methylophilus sp.]HSH85727.1 phosphatase PAP2 family protein [Methylophilus sp.]